jgi:single-strand DNA-binding protein
MKKEASTKATAAKAAPSWAVNRVQLVGRLAADPTTRQTKAGCVATLRVVTNSTREPEFHTVAFWGERAADCSESLHKGSPVHIEGRLRTRAWTAADGSTRRSTEIVADLVEPFDISA